MLWYLFGYEIILQSACWVIIQESEILHVVVLYLKTW